jgi:hypothetical protein
VRQLSIALLSVLVVLLCSAPYAFSEEEEWRIATSEEVLADVDISWFRKVENRECAIGVNHELRLVRAYISEKYGSNKWWDAVYSRNLAVSTNLLVVGLIFVQSSASAYDIFPEYEADSRYFQWQCGYPQALLRYIEIW